MGDDSASSSSSSSSSVSDSYNQNLTASLGQQALGVVSGGDSSIGDIDYQIISGSGNVSNVSSYGASSPASGSSGTSDATTGRDWTSYLPYLLVGGILLFTFFFKKG